MFASVHPTVVLFFWDFPRFIGGYAFLTIFWRKNSEPPQLVHLGSRAFRSRSRASAMKTPPWRNNLKRPAWRRGEFGPSLTIRNFLEQRLDVYDCICIIYGVFVIVFFWRVQFTCFLPPFPRCQSIGKRCRVQAATMRAKMLTAKEETNEAAKAGRAKTDWTNDFLESRKYSGSTWDYMGFHDFHEPPTIDVGFALLSSCLLRFGFQMEPPRGIERTHRGFEQFDRSRSTKSFSRSLKAEQTAGKELFVVKNQSISSPVLVAKDVILQKFHLPRERGVYALLLECLIPDIEVADVLF